MKTDRQGQKKYHIEGEINAAYSELVKIRNMIAIHCQIPHVHHQNKSKIRNMIAIH
jgi:hypothetical protein